MPRMSAPTPMVNTASMVGDTAAMFAAVCVCAVALDPLALIFTATIFSTHVPITGCLQKQNDTELVTAAAVATLP